jgi:hypothetical protein
MFKDGVNFQGNAMIAMEEGNQYFLIHDGKRAVFTDPQGYDYARYLTPMFTLQLARDLKKNTPPWFDDLSMRKGFATGKVIKDWETAEAVANDYRTKYVYIESTERQEEASTMEKKTIFVMSADEVPGADDGFSAKKTMEDLLIGNHGLDVEVLFDPDQSALYIVLDKDGDSKKVKEILSSLGVTMESREREKMEDKLEEVRQLNLDELKNETKLEELREQKVKEDAKKYLSMEEATKKLIESLTERNKQLQKKVDGQEQEIQTLKELNRAMDDLRRKEKLTELQDALLAQHPQLEKCLHLLNKETTVDGLRRTAKELVQLFKTEAKVQEPDPKPLKKQERVAKDPAPGIMEDIGEPKVSSDSEALTEGIESSMTRLAEYKKRNPR